LAQDPRANTQLVKPCPPAYLGRSAAELSNSSNDARKFYNGIGKVGDLEVLNNKRIFGSEGSRVGQGLRTLSSVSNSVRTGCGALPTVIGSAIGTTLDQGANWVLDNVGFSKTIVDQVQYFSPAIANQAYGQAKQIFQKVQQGNFKLTDIPNALQDFQNLERLARNIYNPPAAVTSIFHQFCEASPYAIDMAMRNPKYKFLFLVQFIFNSAYTGISPAADFTFMVKNSTRPNMRIDQEDVNFYNFRSKVITKTGFEDMKMSFHDDGQNLATRFWVAYQRATSPISNLSQWSSLSLAEEDGLNFDFVDNVVDQQAGNVSTPVTAASSASLGSLAGIDKQIIQEIRLFHVFNWGQSMNVFQFFNPRITQLEMDDVDMAVSNEVNSINTTFNFDSVYIATDVALDSKYYDIQSKQRGAFYILKNVTSPGESGPSNIGFQPGPQVPNADQCNPGGLQNTKSPPSALPPGAISVAPL
jgi:hypothetical protein